MKNPIILRIDKMIGFFYGLGINLFMRNTPIRY